jgi:hypothetical protein
LRATAAGKREVDEVKVFEAFGGDLPVHGVRRKLKGKRPRATGLTGLQHHSKQQIDVPQTGLEFESKRRFGRFRPFFLIPARCPQGLRPTAPVHRIRERVL